MGSLWRHLHAATAQVCARAEDWGLDQRWIEPWDDSAARVTVRKIMHHWYKHPLGSTNDDGGGGIANDSDAGGEGSAGRGVGTSLGLEQGSELAHGSGGSEEQGAGQLGVNRECGHVACSLRPWCVIDELM